MKDDFKIVIASDIDFEELVAEIYHGDIFLALISQDKGSENLSIVLAKMVEENYKMCLEIGLDDFLKAISAAKQKLVGKV